MEPLLVLFLLPVLIGLVSEWIFRDMRHASVAATIGCVLFVYVCLKALDPDGTWHWLAAFLVLPLPIAFALAAVIACYGRSQARRRHPGRDA
jgi:hypothetical protein